MCACVCACVCASRDAKRERAPKNAKEAIQTQKTLSHLLSCECMCAWAINKPHVQHTPLHCRVQKEGSAKIINRCCQQQQDEAQDRGQMACVCLSHRMCRCLCPCVRKWKADVESSAQLTGPSTGLHQQWQQQQQQEQQTQKSMLRLGAEIKCDLFARLRTETESQYENKRERGRRRMEKETNGRAFPDWLIPC